ncbi:hypothetical protein BGX31_003384 [Mortierella sp. GBA43]|nr:hypothetical protein BGX31_003384 [Mortierella sp. GBA43]
MQNVKNPLELPEVAENVASHLSVPDLASCHGPRPNDLCHYRHLIRDLTLLGDTAGLDKYYYPNLRKLGVYFDENQRAILFEFTEMLPRLSEVILSSVKVEPESWYVLLAHSHMEKLRLEDIAINVVDSSVFWRACSRLSSLELEDTTIEGRIPEDVVFSRMSKLTMRRATSLDLEEQLRLILQCPALKELTWFTSWHIRPPTYNDPIPDKNWSHLSRVFIGHPLPDTDLAFILEGIGNLVHLKLSYCWLGEQSSRVLSRHFSTLVNLNLTECQGVSSLTLRDVLGSCPRLETLQGGDIFARDIVKGGPWICQRLCELSICFLFEESERDLQPEIFGRLSTLNRLERLSMATPSRYITIGEYHVLEFRLENGLRRLESLHQVRHVYFDSDAYNDRYYIPQLDKDEIAWILLHWKKLESMYGTLNSCGRVDGILKKMLGCSDIRTR